MRDKPSVVVAQGMKLPSLTTPEGLFDYLIGGIVLLAALIGIVLLLVLFGFF